MQRDRHRKRYNRLTELLDSPRFVFMNHGYSRLDGADDFTWLAEQDNLFKYSVNLVRYLLSGVKLDGADVLDVGCGRGGTCSYIARYAKPRSVVGLDLSEGNIDFCRRVHGFDAVSFAHGDAQALPFPPESFDVVVNIESSHCYPDLMKFFSEVHRVLRPRGVFCYTDGHHSRFAVAARLAIRGSGFRVLREEDIHDEVTAAMAKSRLDLAQFYVESLQENGKVGPESLDLVLGTLSSHHLHGYWPLRVLGETVFVQTGRYQLWRLQKPEQEPKLSSLQRKLVGAVWTRAVDAFDVINHVEGAEETARE